MRLLPMSCLLALAAARLPAADDSWKNKSIQQWDVQDATQVLADSPWVKIAKVEQVRDLSEAERRDSGDWDAGEHHGVGLAGTGIFGSYNEHLAIERAHAHPDHGMVMIRWESALPIRAAEKKVGETDAPTWQGDYYAIAVYNIPLPHRWNLANELKDVAWLKRDKKKDLKPAKVLILPHQDTGLSTVVYLFSRSAEITRKDPNIRFMAQVRRLFVSQFFFPKDMQFQGQPEL